MKLRNIFLGLSLSVSLTGCFDLDKMPEGVLSTSQPFNTTAEMRNYIDQFYQTGWKYAGADYGDGMRIQGGAGDGIAGDDVNSDNMATSSVSLRLSGEMTLSNAVKLKNYSAIRNLNFFLNNLDYCQEKGTKEYNQYVGEAYYFRAWYYYKMFVDYGPLTWLDKPIDPDLNQMKLPRDSRTVVADHILADLDMAASLLSEQDNSKTMRIHKDVALALKSDIALFEGTWEKYHKMKNDKFFDPSITDDKIVEYLTAAADAAKQVMDRGVWKIFSTGNITNDYRLMFQTTDLSNNPEILWFKKYDGNQVGNSVNRYLNQGGGGMGLTASLVDDYLTRSGKPFIGEQKIEAKKIFGDELDPNLRDPRLIQTVCAPGQVLRPDQPQGYVVPPLVGSSAFNQNISGYSLLKHVQIDYTGSLDAEGKGATPAIQFRYADLLLNYAEALAELNGAANAEKIKAALKPLRDRVGMPAVDFDREFNAEPDYPFHKLDKYIQAVRRERRVEKACEGRRLEDILRWAAADVLIKGQWPKGALYTGSNLENHKQYEGKLIYDQPSGNNLFLTGKPGDALRYVVPINPAGYANGMQFNEDRDYLLPIEPRMISLTDNQWTQNPGW